MKIEFDRIVTNAVSAIVVAVVMGAAAIVWRGATTVDSKVRETRADMEHLITSLSDKLGAYQVQLTTISNQLNDVLKHQTNRVARVAATAQAEEADRSVQQKAYSRDIYQQLKK